MQQAVAIFQRVIMLASLAGLAVVGSVLLLAKFRRQADAVLRFAKAHPAQAAFLVPAVFAAVLYGGSKPVTPTVKGITLGTPMEAPTRVSLAWQPDEGTEIGPNQLVTVYWRDAYDTRWHLAGQGYGITNAVVEGFFINRDTDWMVEVAGTNTTEEVAK